MGGRSHHAEFNAHLVPAISALDPYAAGDAFGAAIDLTPYISTLLIKADPQSIWHTYIDIDTINVTDLDDQQASYDIYFRSEDSAVDIVDNDPFNPSGTDILKWVGPTLLPATGNYREVPNVGPTSAKGQWQISNLSVPLQGKKCWVKIVIQDAKTFTGIDRVTFDLTGYLN